MSAMCHSSCERRIKTAVTINRLLEKGIDILTPVPVVEIFHWGAPLTDIAIKSALTSLYNQINYGRRALELNDQDLRTLGCLEYVTLWTVDSKIDVRDPDHEGKYLSSFGNINGLNGGLGVIGDDKYLKGVRYHQIPPDESSYWRIHSLYRVVCIDEPPVPYDTIYNAIQIAHGRQHEGWLSRHPLERVRRSALTRGRSFD